jgi:hypothetical protein
LQEIGRLLDTCESFHFYVDDAYGMRCYGEKGQGYVLSKMKLHPRMILAISLAKAFATGGSVFVFPDQETADLVRNCGGPMITSGLMQPGALGAAVAFGHIHLSEEYPVLRDDLQRKIAFTNRRLLLVAENDSPVFFFGCGLPKVGYNLVERMNKKGHMTNLGVFPAVPMKNTGLRFTITRLNDEEEIDRMVTTLAGQHHLALRDEAFDLRKVQMAFKMKISTKRTEVEEFIEQFKVKADMDISHDHSIIDLNAVEWNEMHAGDGAYDAKNLSLFEDIFHSGTGLGNHWEWDYITIRDAQGRIILSTFLTTARYKDDMLASNEVSAHIETIREKKGQDFMTTRTLSIGCPITTGKHMYIDAAHPLKEKALRAFMDKLQEIQETRAVDNVILRDFIKMDEQVDYLIKENGFMRSAMPSGDELDLAGLSSLEDFIGRQSY